MATPISIPEEFPTGQHIGSALSHSPKKHRGQQKPKNTDIITPRITVFPDSDA